MNLLDRQMGAVHLPEAKEVFSHMGKRSSKPDQQKWSPKVSSPMITMHRRAGKGGKGSRDGKEYAGTTRTLKGMGKADLRPLERHSFPQT